MSAKIWLKDPAIYPILVTMGAAVGLVAFASGRYLTKCPDIRINKVNRAMQYRENYDEGINWVSHKPALAYLRPNAINTHAESVAMSRTLSRRNTKEHFDTTKA